MNSRKITSFLSATPLFITIIQLLFPSISESLLTTVLFVLTAVCFFCISTEKEDSLGIGLFSAFLVFLIGVDRVHDYFRYDYGSLGSLAEAVAFILCSVEYFHYMFRYTQQSQKLKDFQYFKDRCHHLEDKLRDLNTEMDAVQKRYQTNIKATAILTRRNNEKYDQLLKEYEELKQKSESC